MRWALLLRATGSALFLGMWTYAYGMWAMDARLDAMLGVEVVTVPATAVVVAYTVSHRIRRFSEPRGLRSDQYAAARRAIRRHALPGDPRVRGTAAELAQQRLSGENSPGWTASILCVPLSYALYTAASGRVPHWLGVALMLILLGPLMIHQLRTRATARRYLALASAP